MKSNKAKSLQRIGGKTLLEMICQTASKISEKITLIVGFDKESILKESKEYGLDISSCEQPEPKGTGDAVNCGISEVTGANKVLVLYGDVPLIKEKTLLELINNCNEGISILTTVLDEPFGYGRVKKDIDGNAIAIIEEKDATEDEKNIKEIFTGVLCSRKEFLKDGLLEIKNDNAAGEFYLTDIVSIMSNKGIKINTHIASNNEVKGANSHTELAELEEIYRQMKVQDLLDMGITVSDPSRLDVRGEITSGKDCSIDVNVILEGDVEFGDNVSIGPNCVIKNSSIKSNSKVDAFSHIDGSMIGEGCVIGPYARLREGSQIEAAAKVGNFVETKNIVLGEGSKANHLTYLGDANIGKETNVGAGTITCNYDGKDKHKTVIGDESFIGSNSALVAPVTIGSNVTVAAGSVITKDVPDNALGLGRAKQSNRENWSKKKD
jgi:bifunctional UDP-N-acetylglucosamine pyrophosphorylase/glucosamine-1-phosphate N-acetyltransferase